MLSKREWAWPSGIINCRIISQHSYQYTQFSADLRLIFIFLLTDVFQLRLATRLLLPHPLPSHIPLVRTLLLSSPLLRTLTLIIAQWCSFALSPENLATPRFRILWSKKGGEREPFEDLGCFNTWHVHCDPDSRWPSIILSFFHSESIKQTKFRGHSSFNSFVHRRNYCECK